MGQRTYITNTKILNQIFLHHSGFQSWVKLWNAASVTGFIPMSRSQLHLYKTNSCVLARALRNFCPYSIQSGRHLKKTNRQMFCTLILPRLSIQLTTPLFLKSWNDTVLRANYLVGFLTTFWTDRRESWLMAKPPCVYRSLLVYPRVALLAHSSLWY